MSYIIGANCIIGALTFVPAGMQVPERKVVVGNPARIVKDASDEMIAWKTEGTGLYQALPRQLHDTLRAVEPLREITEDEIAGRRSQVAATYRTWKETQSR